MLSLTGFGGRNSSLLQMWVEFGVKCHAEIINAFLGDIHPRLNPNVCLKQRIYHIRNVDWACIVRSAGCVHKGLD